MKDLLVDHFSEILAFIGGFFAGGVTISLVKVNFKRRNTVDGSGSLVDQSSAQARGDIIGRDKKTGMEPQRKK